MSKIKVDSIQDVRTELLCNSENDIKIRTRNVKVKYENGTSRVVRHLPIEAFLKISEDENFLKTSKIVDFYVMREDADLIVFLEGSPDVSAYDSVSYKSLKKLNDRDVVKTIVIKNGEELTEKYKEKIKKKFKKVVIKNVE
ncbi:hypothetical protein [Psychrilyobacter sp.]|uniref:hypothetical protein n=1 Tax=Psychrilyobacter sp. TaxID=2586924 RepID=UPI0030192C3A